MLLGRLSGALAPCQVKKSRDTRQLRQRDLPAHFIRRVASRRLSFKAMLPTPNTSPQREALVNCTNVTPETIHNFHKLPTPPSHSLVKRSRPAHDGAARLKRLKFTIGESRTGEDEEEDNVDSDESEEDNSAALCKARRKHTIFHAKNALAMSRPGVTCRPLPRKSKFVITLFCR